MGRGASRAVRTGGALVFPSASGGRWSDRLSGTLRALAWTGRRGSAVALRLVVAVAADQSRSPALADIIGAGRVRTAGDDLLGIDPLQIRA